MATTTKTLTPTNQQITLPDMTERPNNSVQVDSIGKLADAVNALNSDLNELHAYNYFNETTMTFDMPRNVSSNNNGNYLLFNANQGTLALIRADLNPSITKIVGTTTFGITVSGKTVTITSTNTLWGRTIILGSES